MGFEQNSLLAKKKVTFSSLTFAFFIICLQNEGILVPVSALFVTSS